MDTKWKKRKVKLSFIIYFLGISLLIGSVLNIVWLWRGEDFSWQKLRDTVTNHLFAAGEEDYQNKEVFREEISRELEIFLTMATGGSISGHFVGNAYILDGINAMVTDSGIIWGNVPGNDGSEYKIRIITQEATTSQEETVLEGPQDGSSDPIQYYKFYTWPNDDSWLYQDNWEEYLERGNYSQEQEEEYRKKRGQLEADWKEAARQYHESIRGDKNLLYGIYNDGELLYSNLNDGQAEELLNWQQLDSAVEEGRNIPVPYGYNFVLYFDGQKVSIYKDGKAVDVYGNGFYRDENDWYVPGYTNFPVDEDYRSVKIYMAAAKEPVQYTEGRYGSSYYRLSCPLYWMSQESSTSSMLKMQFLLVLLAVSLLLLIVAFMMKKSRKAAAQIISEVTVRFWIEIKILIWISVLWILFGCWNLTDGIYRGDWYGWPERTVASSSLLLLFWMLYLSVNELRYQKGEILKHGITAKLIALFSIRELKLPLAQRVMRRNFILYFSVVLPGVSLLALLIVILFQINGWNYLSYDFQRRFIWIGISVFLILFLLLLVLCYFIGKKNRQTVSDLERLTDRIGEIRNGKYEPGEGEIPPSDHDLYQAMADLEDIRSGIETAIEEQMKSERMKVELIANVSHDLKTPLTSIISYVQILKQEENLPEHVKDYIKILDEKSQRLKNMVQDVFTISKAASKELPVNIEVLDFGKLIRQTLADMDEEIQSSVVNFRTNLPVEPVMIRADGQRMYRVFQNLFQNAIKYSLEGSRVHVTLKQDGQVAVASVKNTSRMELLSSVNYAERFTRGDESRTDGGSGLGLSIAQSFTEACGGQFLLETIADLFVVTVSFPVVEEENPGFAQPELSNN